MKTFDNELLIESVPPELLLGLSLFIGLVFVVLFLLALEAGTYPQLLKMLRRIRAAMATLKTKNFWKEVTYVEG